MTVGVWNRRKRVLEDFQQFVVSKTSCTFVSCLIVVPVAPQSSDPGWMLSLSGCFIALSAGVGQ